MYLLFVKEHHAQHKIDDENGHQRDDHGRRGTLPDTFGAADSRRPPPSQVNNNNRRSTAPNATLLADMTPISLNSKYFAAESMTTFGETP